MSNWSNFEQKVAEILEKKKTYTREQRREYHHEYYLAHREHYHEYYLAHREQILESKRKKYKERKSNGSKITSSKVQTESI